MKTIEQQRAERLAMAQRTDDPLADYDPAWFSRVSLRKPAGWPPCTCSAAICPDRDPSE
ncbi:hypothetical protein [Kitasatospora sp. GAS1066B]|uniref:hypothetical protein n=1 Tax=Kitasatospora sp. GAS1066B TaxID=3156271 RepID=UPI0035189D24